MHKNTYNQNLIFQNKRLKLLSSCILTFLFLSSCGETDFKRIELLEGFRILAITTSTPEVNPGDTVSDLQVYFSDPGSGGRAITGTTVACIDPGLAFGAPVSCDHDPFAVSGNYNFNTGTDDNSMGLFTGLASTTASVTVPANILLGRSARDQLNGVGYIIIFTFDVSGTIYKTFKRILVSTRATKNLNPGNPTPSVLNRNGGPMALPLDDDTLQVLSSTEETFDFVTTENITETRTEKFQVAWYISQGELSLAKTNVNENTIFTTDSSALPFTLIAVLRDERGGVEILEFHQ